MLKDMIAALTLLTKLPLGLLHGKCGDFGRAVIHFPLAGYLSFALWSAVYGSAFFLFKDGVIAACLALAAVYYFFNLFHFDGFLDSVDGLLSQKPREEVLRIMKLGNIGPTALFAGVLYLALKIYLAVKLGVFVLLPVFVISRLGMSFSAWLSKPAADSGLGSTIIFGNTRFLGYASLYLAPLFIVHRPLMLFAMIAVAAVADIIVVIGVERRIGGLTGDNFGLVNELNELLLMLTAFYLA